MQLSQSELAEKSAFILSKIREKYPDFREMELSGVQDINDALIRVKNAVLLLRAGWSERYDEAMKRFLAEKPEGYKLQSLDYDSISKAVGAYPSCPPNVVREICGLSSEYELHEASSIRNSASEEFSRILRERRIADGSLLWIEYDELRELFMRATLPFAKEWTLAELEAEREKTVHYIAEADLAMEEATKNALALMSAELEAQGRKIEHLREWEKRHWMEANSKEYRSAKRAKAKRDKQRRYAEALSLPGAERMFEKWKLKATSFNGARGRFETAGDVIRHNFALVESLWEIKTVYSWRLYEYSPNSWSWEEHSRGTTVASSEDELKKILSERYGREIVDKWKGDESGHSSRLKLWLRGSEPLNPPALQGVCSHCGNQYNDRSITIRKHSESENEWYSIFSETARFPWRTEVTTACIKDKSTSENDFCSEECAAAFHGLDLFEIDARRRANDEFGRALLGIDGYIYRIWNKANGKSYVGKTNRDFLQRWKEHFGLTYTNPIFRDDLKAHGMESFAFEILEAIGGEPLKAFIEERKAVGHLDYSNERSLCEVYTLNREQFWIDRFDSVKSGYNQRDNFRR